MSGEASIERGLSALAAGCTEDEFVAELRRLGSTGSDETLRRAYRELRLREQEEPRG